MASRRTLLRAGGAFGAAALTGACSSHSHPATKVSSRALIPVTILTGFGDTPREQYPRVAAAKGLLAKAG
jgi:hypothetical protein